MLNSNYQESNTASELVNSVAKYYGFYIARFEASSYEVNGKKVATSLSGRIPWTNVTFIEANQAANDMSVAFNYEDGIKTAIANSYAIDTTLEWINESVENYSTNTSYGNYSGTILPTGQTKSDIVNNICDLAGNVREWTTEIDKSATNSTSNKKTETTDANSITKRIVRGGSANLSRTASARTGNSENLSDEYWGFRVVLYK
jgi:formylglycine-generating enzyme required for sulfatase activity